MIAFFEDSNFYDKLEQLFARNEIPARGFRDYHCLTENLRDCQPKVVLLDIEINDQANAGLEALSLIRDRFPRIKTIMLTSHPEHVLRAFRAGADGYLLKEEVTGALEYLQEIIQEVTYGKIYMSEEVQRHIVESLKPFEKVHLNTRELHIISLAASDKSGPQIAELLHLKPQTVETYLKNIKTKMSCHTIQGVVAKAIRNHLINWDDLLS